MRRQLALVLALSTLAGIFGGCVVVSNGQFQTSWSMTINGSPATCADVGAAKFEIIATLQGTSQGDSFIYNCGVGSATLDPLQAGTYTLSASLLDSNSNVVMGPSSPITATLYGNDVVSVGNYNFAFFFYNLSFKIKYGSPGSISGDNCDSTTAGTPGAGVYYQNVVLARGGQCLSYTLSGLTAGGGSVDTCVNNVCQHDNVVETIYDLSPASYTVNVYGMKASFVPTPYTCYISATTVANITNNDVNIPVIYAPFDTSLDTNNYCNKTKI